MATPHTQFPNVVLDSMALHDLNKRELKLALALVRRTNGYHRPTVLMPSAEWVRATGLAPGNIREVLAGLLDREIFYRDADGAYGLNDPKDWLVRPAPKKRRSSALKQGAGPTQNKAGPRLVSRREAPCFEASGALKQGGKAPCFKAPNEPEIPVISRVAGTERKKENFKETSMISSSSSFPTGGGGGMDRSQRPRRGVVVPLSSAALPFPASFTQAPDIDGPWSREELFDFLTEAVFRHERETCLCDHFPAARLKFVLPAEWQTDPLGRLELLVGRFGPSDYPGPARAWRERRLLQDSPREVWEQQVRARLAPYPDVLTVEILRAFREQQNEGYPPVALLTALEQATRKLAQRRADPSRPIPEPTKWMLSTWKSERELVMQGQPVARAAGAR